MIQILFLWIAWCFVLETFTYYKSLDSLQCFPVAILGIIFSSCYWPFFSGTSRNLFFRHTVIQKLPVQTCPKKLQRRQWPFRSRPKKRQPSITRILNTVLFIYKAFNSQILLTEGFVVCDPFEPASAYALQIECTRAVCWSFCQISDMNMRVWCGGEGKEQEIEL